MKSINAKKLAAVTLGAALLGASFVAAAPIMYKNTQIINDQGKPVVKVVVGANAKASDGVAAANIAAVIGSLAYQSKTVSAQLTGTPTCSVTGTGSGSCPVSDKKVTLEITTPGTATVAGGYGFRTYGYGFIDDNRTTEDNQIPDGSAKKITGDNIAAFADYKTSVSSVSGSFTETQEMYIQTTSEPAWDSDKEKYYIQPSLINYTIKFDHDTFDGVPKCVKESELVSTCSDDNKIDRQRLKIKYLGEEWIISDMTNGTSVKLAKEATPAQIVYVGQNISAGAYTVQLAGVLSPQQGNGSILKVYDANGQMVKQDIATADETKEITLPNGDKISIHVYKLAADYSAPYNSWVEMAVYSQELTLDSGSTVDDDKNDKWHVDLTWGDYTYNSVTKTNVVLKSISLWREDFDEMYMGDSVNIIESPAPYKFVFSDWTISDAQRDTLTAKFERISSFYANESTTDSTSIGDVDTNRTFVCFTSDKKAFDVGGDMRSKFCVGLTANLTLYDKNGKYYNASGFNGTADIDYEINDDSSYDKTISFANSSATKLNITVYERVIKDTNPTTNPYFKWTADLDAKKFYKDVSGTTEDQVLATSVTDYDGSSVTLSAETARDVGYVSQKGSVLKTKSGSTVVLSMAKKLGEFQYYLMPSSSTVQEGTLTQTLSEGQQVSVQESTVKVKEISATVGACSVSGGSAACTASSAGMSAVLDVAGTPASATFAVPYKMSSTERLVVLDSEAPTAESLILVGGQLVNSLTASAIAGTDVKIDKPGVKVVSAVSDNRIVVAGYTAEDTQQAAADFISELLAQVQ